MINLNKTTKTANQADIIKASIKSLSDKLDSGENKLMINNKLKAELIELDELKEEHPEDFL